MIVADTCLIFHLFNDSTHTTCAQEVLSKDSHWIFPPLWREEYADVISKLARKERLDISEVLGHFNHTVEELKKSEVAVDTADALEASLKYKISVYDAHFVVLALRYETLLVTEDKEILKNCSMLAVNMQTFLNHVI